MQVKITAVNLDRAILSVSLQVFPLTAISVFPLFRGFMSGDLTLCNTVSSMTYRVLLILPVCGGDPIIQR